MRSSRYNKMGRPSAACRPPPEWRSPSACAPARLRKMPTLSRTRWRTVRHNLSVASSTPWAQNKRRAVRVPKVFLQHYELGEDDPAQPHKPPRILVTPQALTNGSSAELAWGSTASVPPGGGGKSRARLDLLPRLEDHPGVMPHNFVCFVALLLFELLACSCLPRRYAGSGPAQILLRYTPRRNPTFGCGG